MSNRAASLSLQKYSHRAGHWIVVKGIVVKGTLKVTCGGKSFPLSENPSTHTPIGEIHRLHNPGKQELELTKVQTDDYLGEDDIVRLEDIYDR